MTPKLMRPIYLIGATGHSQGIISAVVISASETDKEFVDNTQKALGLLFWIGARCQAACPTTTVNPNILEDSLESGEGVPTPMLSIVGRLCDYPAGQLRPSKSHHA